jgi:hypothetical protein
MFERDEEVIMADTSPRKFKINRVHLGNLLITEVLKDGLGGLNSSILQRLFAKAYSRGKND